MTGAITFKIMLDSGILPVEWPQARERKSQNAKAASVAATLATPSEAAQTDKPQDVAPLEAAEESERESIMALAIIQPAPLAAIIMTARQTEAIEEGEQPAEKATEEDIEATPKMRATLEIAYNVTGEQRKRPGFCVRRSGCI